MAWGLHGDCHNLLTQVRAFWVELERQKFELTPTEKNVKTLDSAVPEQNYTRGRTDHVPTKNKKLPIGSLQGTWFGVTLAVSQELVNVY